jgi:hypothetical protein
MCGRYCISSAPEAIRRLFRYRQQPNFPPRYNVAPTQPVPIVRLAQGEREFALVRGGLIPAWVKDPREFSLLINARGESVNDKPAASLKPPRRSRLKPPTRRVIRGVDAATSLKFSIERPGSLQEPRARMHSPPSSSPHKDATRQTKIVSLSMQYDCISEDARVMGRGQRTSLLMATRMLRA